MSLDDWNAVLTTNFTGAFLCLREAVKVMARRRGGVIVNISSVHEFIPWPGFADYCASKGGMKLLMETAARERAGRNVRVVNVAPGAIVTPINNVRARRPGSEARGRGGDPAWPDREAGRDRRRRRLGGERTGSYVTGTTIVVDGGMSLYPKFV